MAASASFALLTPLKLMPSGLSSERAAAFRPLTSSRSSRLSSLMTRMRLAGLALSDPIIRRMAEPAVVEFVIPGVAHDGKPFRPSDWGERLWGGGSPFRGAQAIQYWPFLHPRPANGLRS